MTDAAGNTVRQSKFQLFNMPVTAVLRWLGAHGFTATEAGAVLDFNKLEVPPVTMKGHLGDGKHGDGKKGRSGRTIPALTAEQEAELMKFKLPPAAPETKPEPKAETKPATKKSKGKKNAAPVTETPAAPKKSAKKSPATPKATTAAPKAAKKSKK